MALPLLQAQKITKLGVGTARGSSLLKLSVDLWSEVIDSSGFRQPRFDGSPPPAKNVKVKGFESKIQVTVHAFRMAG